MGVIGPEGLLRKPDEDLVLTYASVPTPQGLLLFTNSGPLADKLTDPDSCVWKEYLAWVAGGVPSQHTLVQTPQTPTSTRSSRGTESVV